MDNIIIKPLVTEKITAQGETLNRYGFIVNVKANKIEIKDAIQKMYNVSIANINTLRYSGKLKSRFTKTGVIEGRKNAYKKAIITLAGGEKIDFYSNI
jgi:large subunit ribosomal protein L23